MMLQVLRRNPFLQRELEVRACGEQSYEAFGYGGPGLLLLVLQAPVLYALILSSCGGAEDGLLWSSSLFLVTSWLLVLYFAQTAARVCAGSFAVERERGTIDALRLVPCPPRTLFAAKYVASVAPLLVEALATAPCLALYAVFGTVGVVSVATIVVTEVTLVLTCGMIGMYWSLHSRDVLSALSRSYATVAAALALPLVLATFLRLSYDIPGGAVFHISPLGLVTRFIPIGPASLACEDALALGLFVGGAAGCTFLLYCSCLRRLARH